MPTPREIQQAIDAAARVARAAAIAWREQQAGIVRDQLQQLADALHQKILALAGPDGRLPPEAIGPLRDWLDARLAAQSVQFRDLLDESLQHAATIGTRVLLHTGTVVTAPTVVAGVLQYLQAFRGADGLQLSDRLWRLERGAAAQLHGAIEGAIMRGQSSFQATQAFVDAQQAVPADLAAGVEAGQAGRIATDARRLLVNPNGDVLYAAQRVIRTETNRAYTESYVASAATHPDVVGVRFNLSPNHPRPDICDFYAHANLHGLGPGVYPPGNNPYPAHPNTLSYLTTVFTDQVSDDDRAGQVTPFQWLADQPAATQDAVLGHRSKGAAFRAGQLHPSDLRTPWSALAARSEVTA